MNITPKALPTMKLYVWANCVNFDYTGGDLCVMAPTLPAARKLAAAAYGRSEFSTDGGTPWMRKPDRVLSGDKAVHASYGGG